MPKLTQPLKWHGGKHYLARMDHRSYGRRIFTMWNLSRVGSPCCWPVIPTRDWMATNGEKLPSHQRGGSEVVNDRHGALTNFWKVMQDEKLFARFLRKVEATPFSQVEWDKSATQGQSKVDRAVNLFVRCRQSRGGKGKEFATLPRTRTRRSMNEACQRMVERRRRGCPRSTNDSDALWS